MRGIPPHELFQCPSRESGHWSRSRDGGYMRRAMAVPERQLSLHAKIERNRNVDFSSVIGIKSRAKFLRLWGLFALPLFGAGCGDLSPERMAAMLASYGEEASLPLPAAGKQSASMPYSEERKIIKNELFRAVVDGEGAGALQKIIDAEGSYLLALNDYGDTPLGAAIKRRNPQAALYLLRQMTNDQLLHQNKKGEGYLYLAAERSYKGILDLLSDRFYQSKADWILSDYEFSDLDMETAEGEKALHAAGSSVIAGALEYQYYRGFLEAPFRKFQFHLNHRGQSFLHTAARGRRGDVLNWGAGKNCVSRREWQSAFWSRPFIMAWEAVQSYGGGWADFDNLINHQDKEGQTALHISAGGLFAGGIQALSQCVYTDYLLPDIEGNIPLLLFLRALDKSAPAQSRGIKDAFSLLLRGQNALKA